MHWLAWVFFGYAALPFARALKAVRALRRGDPYEYSWWDRLGREKGAVNPELVLLHSLATIVLLVIAGALIAVFM
jgi:hypothetical protein